MNLLWSLVRKTCHWEHTSTLTLSPVLSFILLSRSDFSQQRPGLHIPVSLCHCSTSSGSTVHHYWLVYQTQSLLHIWCDLSSGFNYLETSSTGKGQGVGESPVDWWQWCWRFRPFLRSNEAHCKSLGCDICAGELPIFIDLRALMIGTISTWC